MELPTGVYAFPQTIERNDMTTTIYPSAVEIRTGILLIDVGFPGLTAQVESNLADAGYDWQDVVGVVLTHHDGDHAGSLATVVEKSNAAVYAHERCAPYVDGRKEPIKSPEGERYPSATVDIELVDGVRFDTTAGPMEVVFTPGHAPGHISLYFPKQALLIAGDALTADENSLQGPSEQYTLDMEEALNSVGTLTERDIDRTLCHHGGLVEAGSDRIDTLVT